MNGKRKSIFSITKLAALVVLVLVVFASITACSSAGKAAGVTNGNFEKVGNDKLPTGWTFSSYSGNAANSTAVVIKDAAGNNVVKIVNKAEDDAHLVTEVNVKPNTVYSFKVFAMTTNVEGGAGANIGLEDINCYSSPLLGSNEWKELELVGKTGENQKTLKIGCRLGNYGATSKGTAYFSNFRMEELKSYSGTPQSFASKNSSSSSSTTNTTVDEKEYRARMTTATFTVLTFILVPLAAGFLIWYEHAAEKRRGGTEIKSPAQKAPSFFSATDELPKKTDTKLHYTKLDWLFVCLLTAVYAVLAVTNLGSLKAPYNEWKGNARSDATFIFDGQVTIKEIWQNGGITGGSASSGGNTTYTLTGTNGVSVEASQRYGIMYRWNKLDVPSSGITTDKLVLKATKGQVWLNEIAFFDENGQLLKVRTEDPADAALVDEQDCVPEYPSYMSGMYFDELYHARTAYENVHNLKVYEVSHPPLGKLIISIGVRIFGMTPFGWRIMGALFGVLMVPLMYAFGKRLFKRPWLALLTAVLLTFDFMHYSQTRIATIDSYGVFFNMCMTYYMYKFIKMDLGDSFGSTIVPLALSGLFFGLGCASKWICIYTGAALAVLFFAKMIMLGIKARKINKAEHTPEEMEEPAVKNARQIKSRIVKTILCCIPLFIVIPAIIYFASYYPYYTSEWKANAINTKVAQITAEGGQADPSTVELTLPEKAVAYVKGVVGNQLYMYNYHSRLTTRHAYESAWYEWPLSNRPMWFYAGYNHPDKTLYGTISSFGNPAVWWICFAGTVFFVLLALRGRFKMNTEVFFLLVCMASSMLPWMLISRSVFIYHYFATVPTIILASVYVLKHYEDRYYYVPKEMGEPVSGAAKAIPAVKFVWMAVVVALFGLFYPVITGIPVSKKYIDSLEWLPTWTFRGIWPDIWHK